MLDLAANLPPLPEVPFHPEEPGFQSGSGQGAPRELLLADLGPGWSRGGKCVPVLPQLEWVTTAQGSTRQDEAWDPPCAHSSGVPAGH